MNQIIINGGNPIKDCPVDWPTASQWEDAANKGSKQSERPIWRFDCGFKLDFDGPIVSFESRFYPPKTHNGPKWDGSVRLLVLGKQVTEKAFSCETLQELHTQVVAFRDECAASLADLLAKLAKPDPTADLLAALQTAQRALVEAGDQIRSREGHSFAYRRAANAGDVARDAIIRYRMATDAN